jgi:hypothetical protein
MSEIQRGVIGVALCLFVLTSGCAGILAESGPAVFAASPASVSDAAVSGTHFEHQDTRVAWINRTVEVAGQSREVRVKNHVSIYQRPAAVDLDGSVTFGLFVVAATPKASIAGQALNPIGRMSHEEMIEQFTSRSDGVRDVQRVDSRTLSVLGTEADVVRFSGVVERSGHEVPVYIEVTRIGDGDDFVVAVSAYPQATADEVRPDVTTLLEGIEH